MDNIKAVILAGGKGTRLHPVTLESPKPLLTVKRWPILNHLIDFLVKYGVDEIDILISESHQQDFAWWKKRYKKALPRKTRLHIEREALGTFGGLKFVKPPLKKTFIMTNGDELKDFNLEEAYNFHIKNPAHPIATIALVKVSDPSHYGVPIMDGDMIKEFLEKPQNPPSDYVSSGFYFLEPEVFKYADWSKGFLMIERDIFPKIAADGKLAGYRIDNGRWYDTGTFERWEKAIKEW